MESGGSTGPGRMKLPDAWSSVLKIDDKLTLPIKPHWVQPDVEL